MKPTLFEIANAYRADIEKLGDLDLPDDVIADTLEGMQGELAVKARSIAAFAADLDTTATAMKEAEARMKARRQAVERRAERLRHYLLAGMQYAQIERIDGPDFTLRLKNNPPAVEVFDQAQVPSQYMRKSAAIEITDVCEMALDSKDGQDWITVSGPKDAFKFTETPIKEAIKAAIKGKQDVPGCRLTHGSRLEIA